MGEKATTAETPAEDPREDKPTLKTTRQVADEYLREEYNMTVDDLPGDATNRLAFERDLAVRQAKLSQADLKVVRLALNENRPLEALRTVNKAVDRLDEELDALGDLEGGLEPREDSDE